MSDETPAEGYLGEVPVPEWLENLPDVLPAPDPTVAALLGAAGLQIECVAVGVWTVIDAADGRAVEVEETAEAAARAALAKLRAHADELAQGAGRYLWTLSPPLRPYVKRKRTKKPSTPEESAEL